MPMAGRPGVAGNARGVIYFLEAPEVSRVKIGFTAIRFPWMRISTHRISSPVELGPMWIMRGSFDDEHRLHARFAKDRRHGEWFSLSKDISDFIENNCKQVRIPPRREWKR